MSRRVVLYGGTFDPVTTAHTVVADQAQRLLQPDEFWFVVDNAPGRRKRVYAPALLRLAMVGESVAGDPRFRVVDIEIRRGGVTYTAETMDALHLSHPADRFELLVGADSARTINSWRYADRLLEREWFDIVNRSGEQPLTLDEAAALGYAPERTQLLEIASPRLSASDVRRRVARGEPLDGLVPQPALDVIRREGLYAGRATRA
ncbi:MAG: nicotinate (nicotinamide) nucleotide adenylyltransferase [Candidatus Dormibacteria bacterium]